MDAPRHSRKFSGFNRMSAHGGPYGVVMHVFSAKCPCPVNASTSNDGLTDARESGTGPSRDRGPGPPPGRACRGERTTGANPPRLVTACYLPAVRPFAQVARAVLDGGSSPCLHVRKCP